MSLPHFTQVTSHNSLWEPAYKNLFEVEILLPEDIAGRHPNSKILLLENTTAAKFPEYPKLDVKEQRYKYSTRLFTGFPNSTSINDMGFTFNVNVNDTKQMFTFRMIKDWYDLAFNNEDGSSNYKKKQVGEIIVYQHDREGEILRRVTYHNCQILGFTGMEEMIWGGGAEIMELQASFCCDYYSDYYF